MRLSAVLVTIALVPALLLLSTGPAALAHDSAHDTDSPREGAAAAPAEAALALTVRLDPATAPAVARVPLGAHVHLTLIGAPPGPLHLHGYDVLAEAAAGAPAQLVFDARHEGRFPLEAHVVDDLLGARHRPVLFVEVRAP